MSEPTKNELNELIVFQFCAKVIADRKSGQSIADAILSDQTIKDIFPISRGDATKASPMVITTKKPYAGHTQLICDVLLESENLEGELSTRGLLAGSDPCIYCYTFNTRAKGLSQWTGTQTYYFDVTIFNKNLPDEKGVREHFRLNCAEA